MGLFFIVSYASLLETLGVVAIKLKNGTVFEMLQSSEVLAQLIEARQLVCGTWNTISFCPEFCVSGRPTRNEVMSILS